MIDVSDGLALDLSRLSEESGCGAVLDLSKIPIAPAAHQLAAQRNDGSTPLDHALADGEDFELILAVPPAAADELKPANRFAVQPSDDGFIRLDTQTGAVSHCGRRAGVWFCEKLVEDQTALEKRIDAVFAAIITMLAVIIAYDQLLFRPLVAFAARFRSHGPASKAAASPAASTCPSSRSSSMAPSSRRTRSGPRSPSTRSILRSRSSPPADRA